MEIYTKLSTTFAFSPCIPIKKYEKKLSAGIYIHIQGALSAHKCQWCVVYVSRV